MLVKANSYHLSFQSKEQIMKSLRTGAILFLAFWVGLLVPSQLVADDLVGAAHAGRDGPSVLYCINPLTGGLALKG
jgi:hypothetical protein